MFYWWNKLVEKLRHAQFRWEYSMELQERVFPDFSVVPAGFKLPDGCTFGHCCVIQKFCGVGAGSIFGKRCLINSGVQVGANCIFGDGCRFGDACSFDWGSVFGAGAVFGQCCSYSGEYGHSGDFND